MLSVLKATDTSYFRGERMKTATKFFIGIGAAVAGLLLLLKQGEAAPNPEPGSFTFSVRISNPPVGDSYAVNWNAGQSYPTTGQARQPLAATSVFQLTAAPGSGQLFIGLYSGSTLVSSFHSMAFTPANQGVYTVNCQTGVVS